MEATNDVTVISLLNLLLLPLLQTRHRLNDVCALLDIKGWDTILRVNILNGIVPVKVEGATFVCSRLCLFPSLLIENEADKSL